MTKAYQIDRQGMSEHATPRAVGSLRSGEAHTGLPLAGGFARKLDLI
jgi:hypothetical protein